MLIPYRGNEILLLNFSNGYCDSLKGKGRTVDYSKDYISSSNECNDYNSLEYNRYAFPTIRVNNSAFLIQLAEEFTSPNISYGQKYFSILIGATYANGCFFGENYLFDNDSIFVNNSNVNYYDSLIIGSSQTYYKIYKLESRNPSADDFHINIVYYNVQIGIVALMDNNGQIIFVENLK